MSIDWTAYNARLNIEGTTNRERNINRFKDNVNRKIQNSPSYKSVKIDDIDRNLVINSGTKPYYKSITSIPNEVFYSGQIVDYANSKYLIKEADSDTELYVDGIMQECDYLLKWQDESGNIIERWCITESNENEGVDENKVMKLGNGQLKVILPYDSETIKIRRDKRFYIDNNITDPIPYAVTNPSTTSNVRNGHGYLTFVVSEDRTNTETDRPDLMLCDYITPTTPPTPPDETIVLFAHISYSGSPTIRIGGYGKTFNATLTDTSGTETTMTAIWTIEPNNYVTYTQNGNSLLVTCDNEDLDGEIVTLSVMDEYSGYSTSIEVTLSVF